MQQQHMQAAAAGWKAEARAQHYIVDGRQQATRMRWGLNFACLLAAQHPTTPGPAKHNMTQAHCSITMLFCFNLRSAALTA
jgi:hypothetical protein